MVSYFFFSCLFPVLTGLWHTCTCMRIYLPLFLFHDSFLLSLSLSLSDFVLFVNKQYPCRKTKGVHLYSCILVLFSTPSSPLLSATHVTRAGIRCLLSLSNYLWCVSSSVFLHLYISILVCIPLIVCASPIERLL